MSIVQGSYNLSLQQTIHKDFRVRDDSTINFRGGPFNVHMNINAIYNLTTNIGDLDQSLLQESSRTNIPVDCILNPKGALRDLFISFDLEFPSSSEELKRRVKVFVDAEDMMTRRIVCLLVLNKFHALEYTRTSYKSSKLNAVASPAISAQLSNLLGSFMGKV